MKTKALKVYIDDSFFDELNRKATFSGLSISAYCRMILSNSIELQNGPTSEDTAKQAKNGPKVGLKWAQSRPKLRKSQNDSSDDEQNFYSKNSTGFDKLLAKKTEKERV